MDTRRGGKVRYGMILASGFFVLCGQFFVMSTSAVAAGVYMSEIAWMGTLPKEGESVAAAANNEWIELLNDSDGAVSLTGWKITADGGVPEMALSGTIPARGFFLLERASDEVIPDISADLIYPYKNTALANTGEHLFLKNTAGEVADEINASSGWPAGDNTTKFTMQRQNSLWITAAPTPKKETQAGVLPVPVSSVTALPSVSGVSSARRDEPDFSISAFAGSDRKEVVGAALEFAGNARGSAGKPLALARFVWTFGDGSNAEGRVVTHAFRVPGIYLVGLHVSSGEFAASDYARIEIFPNQLSVLRVVPGRDGWIALRNAGGSDVDMGGWKMEDSGGHTFFVPVHTRIAARGETAFPNIVTGLFQEEGTGTLAVFYPSGDRAFLFSGPPHPAPVVSVVRASALSVPVAIDREASDPPADSISATSSLKEAASPIAASSAGAFSFSWFLLLMAAGIGILGGGIIFVVRKYG